MAQQAKENQVKALKNRIRKKQQLESRKNKSSIHKKQDFYKSKISQIDLTNKSYIDTRSLSKQSRARQSIANGATHIQVKALQQLAEGLGQKQEKRKSLKLQIMQIDETGTISPTNRNRKDSDKVKEGAQAKQSMVKSIIVDEVKNNNSNNKTQKETPSFHQSDAKLQKLNLQPDSQNKFISAQNSPVHKTPENIIHLNSPSSKNVAGGASNISWSVLESLNNPLRDSFSAADLSNLKTEDVDTLSKKYPFKLSDIAVSFN